MFHQLNSTKQLDWVTYGSAPPDRSLLNDNQPFWNIDSIRLNGNTNTKVDPSHQIVAENAETEYDAQLVQSAVFEEQGKIIFNSTCISESR